MTIFAEKTLAWANNKVNKHLVWENKEESFFNEYSVRVPINNEEKASFREELEEEIKALGFIHEKPLRRFVQGYFWCEIIAFTLYKSPEGKYIFPIDYFMYFIYDCRETNYSAKEGQLVLCEAFKTFQDANELAVKLINAILTIK